MVDSAIDAAATAASVTTMDAPHGSVGTPEREVATALGGAPASAALATAGLVAPATKPPGVAMATGGGGRPDTAGPLGGGGRAVRPGAGTPVTGSAK